MPQALHSPQRPTHFGALQPHSPHRYAVARGAARPFVLVAMVATLGGSTDRPMRPVWLAAAELKAVNCACGTLAWERTRDPHRARQAGRTGGDAAALVDAWRAAH
ncbi:MAG: hypothetical protein WCG47_13935 [Dermatophilaceae bacterium]